MRRELRGARVDRRTVDDKEILVLIVVASEDAADNKRRVEAAKEHFRELNRDKKLVDHIELQIPKHLNSNAMRKAAKRIAFQMESV